MNWCDLKKERDAVAFILSRGIVKEIKRREKIILKDDKSWRYFSGSHFTLTDETRIRRPFDFTDDLETYIGKEIVYWHSSHAGPDETEMCLAEAWENVIKKNYKMIITNCKESYAEYKKYWKEQ